MFGIYIPKAYLYIMNKKDAIMKSALELLANKGVHDTPMSAIAKAAGTGMGTIYNYFANKEILINELYVSIKEKEKDVYVDFDINKPIKTQFEEYFSSIIGFFIENPTYYKFMEQIQASPIITNESREEGNKSLDSVLKLLRKGQQERIIKSVELDELLLFIGGAVLSYLRWYFNKSESVKASLNAQKQMIWDAIKE